MRTEPAERLSLARFATVRILGGGGSVLLVRDLRHGDALRVLKSASDVELDLAAALGGGVLHEARELASLRHPGVPRPVDVGVWPDGRPWLLLEYVRSAETDRPREQAAGGAPPTATPLAVAHGVLDVLAYLHRHGRLHHDVKPGNVVSAENGRIVLLDFGLATREDETIPPRGTLPYVAPEVLAGEPADRRSDLWSLGAVLLRMVLGRDLPPNAVLSPEDVPQTSAIPAEWLRRMLQSKRERRFQTAESALAELDLALGVVPTAPPRRPLPHTPVPVGRRAELDEIARRLDLARRGAPQTADAALVAAPGLILVRGDPGVGKSRLVAEARLRAVEHGWATFIASCADERDAPLPAMGTLLASALADAPADSPAVRRRAASVAGQIASREDRDAAETAARFLKERAAEGPCVLVIVEDVQHANAPALRMLAAIARVAAESQASGTPPRLAVLASLTEGAAPDEIVDAIAALEREGLVATIPLRALAPADVAELVRGVLGPRAPADRVGEILHAHGGSLPLFAEVMLERLVADGALRHESGRWILDTRHAPPLPENLLAAVTARLAALPAVEQHALQLLAAHELPMPFPRAQRLLGESRDALLSSLEARGLATYARDGAGIAPAHAVIGQAALAMMDPADRARLHDALAEAIPRIDPATAALRAYHAARGSDPDAGFQAATEAARRLRAEGEPGRAAAFVRQALRRLRDGDPRIPYLRRSLAELLVASGSPEAAANVYRDLLDHETDRGARVRLLLGLAEALDAAGRAPEVLRACRTALDLIPDALAGDADAPNLRLALLARMAGAQRATGELRGAIDTVKQALPLAVAGRAAERASLLSLLGNVNLQTGDLARARQFHESCLAACRTAGNLRGMAAALHNMGVVEARSGRREEALRSYRQALRIARRTKDLVGVAQTLGNIANLRAEGGEFAAAEHLQRRSLTIRRRAGDLAGVAVTLGNMAALLRARGRFGRALDFAQAAVRRLRALEDAHGEVQFLLLAALIHLHADDFVGARPLLVRALDLARQASLRVLESRTELLFGCLERRAEPKGEEWARRLGRAIALADHVGDRAAAAEAWLETALGERGRGRRGSAMRAWRMGATLAESAGGPDLASRVDLVRARLDSSVDSPEALAAARRHHRYSRESGRRDLQAAAAFALARALLRSGDRDGATTALAEAQEVEEDLTASLPPALRRVREGSAAALQFAELAREIEAGARRADADPSAPPGITDEEEMDQERLLKLLEINKELNRAQDMRALLDTIMDVATATTGAERGFLILVDDGKISFQTARNFRREEVKKPELKISSSLVKRVMKSGQPVLTDNATEDDRFAEYQSVERLELKSIVSVPFRLGESIIGALYLDNPARWDPLESTCRHASLSIL